RCPVTHRQVRDGQQPHVRDPVPQDPQTELVRLVDLDKDERRRHQYRGESEHAELGAATLRQLPRRVGAERLRAQATLALRGGVRRRFGHQPPPGVDTGRQSTPGSWSSRPSASGCFDGLPPDCVVVGSDPDDFSVDSRDFSELLSPEPPVPFGSLLPLPSTGSQYSSTLSSRSVSMYSSAESRPSRGTPAETALRAPCCRSFNRSGSHIEVPSGGHDRCATSCISIPRILPCTPRKITTSDSLPTPT